MTLLVVRLSTSGPEQKLICLPYILAVSSQSPAEAPLKHREKVPVKEQSLVPEQITR